MNPTIKQHNEKIIGYKAVKTDDDGRYYTDGMGNGQRVYFKIGEECAVQGEPKLCVNGLHFFRHYCFALDYLQEGNVILKIETMGEVEEDTEKCVTNRLTVLAVEYQEVDCDKNSGDGNSGSENSGNWNSGNGYRNYFCTDSRFFLFDVECTKEEAQQAQYIDMSWLDLTNKTYKEAWKQCPQGVLKKIKQLKNFNSEKFFEITGIKTEEADSR